MHLAARSLGAVCSTSCAALRLLPPVENGPSTSTTWPRAFLTRICVAASILFCRVCGGALVRDSSDAPRVDLASAPQSCTLRRVVSQLLIDTVLHVHAPPESMLEDDAAMLSYACIFAHYEQTTHCSITFVPDLSTPAVAASPTHNSHHSHRVRDENRACESHDVAL